MRRISIPAIALALLLVFSGALTSCMTIRNSDWSVMSTKPVDISGKFVKKERVMGEKLTFALLHLLPFGWPTWDDACEDALQISNGEFLTNVVVENRFQVVFPGLGHKFGFRVTGNYWMPASGADLEGENLSDVYELRETDDGLAMVNVEDANLVEYVVTKENYEELATFVEVH